MEEGICIDMELIFKKYTRISHNSITNKQKKTPKTTNAKK